MPRTVITGVCGTVGSALAARLMERDQDVEVLGLDNNEAGLFHMERRLGPTGRARFALCDIRDAAALAEGLNGADTVFHCAAFKHVWLCERSPFEAVQTNIHGVQNLIQAARAQGVGRVIFTSSDKAVNPTNVMGTSKLMGEKLMTAASAHGAKGGARADGDGPVFASTRFGNVLGSSGSVVPVFRRQIAAGGPVTLTDPGMTRFVMGIPQAVDLIIDSAELARGGEIFITKMPVARIQDLASVMIEALAPACGHDPASIEVTVTGAMPGEKMYEELMNQEETRRAVELTDYFAVLPAFRGLHGGEDATYPGTVSATVDDPYNSSLQQPLGSDALRGLLQAYGLLDPAPGEDDEPAGRYWPGDWPGNRSERGAR